MPVEIALYGDSILRDFRNSKTQEVHCQRGGKINPSTPHEIIKNLTKKKNSHTVIIIHYGTNNLGAKNKQTRQTIEKFLEIMKQTLDTLQHVKRISIIISSILPRDKHDLTKTIIAANTALKNLCKTYPEHIRFLHSYRLFLNTQKSMNQDLFSDQIHLTAEGTKKLQTLFEIAAQRAIFLKN